MRWTGCDDDMSDDEIIAINRDTFFATDDTAAHWLAFGRAIERRTLDKVAVLRAVTAELEVTIRVMGLDSEPLARMAEAARNALEATK